MCSSADVLLQDCAAWRHDVVGEYTGEDSERICPMASGLVRRASLVDANSVKSS